MHKAVVAGLGAFALSISALVLATGASSKPAKDETLQAACCDELDERVAELSRATALERIDNHTSSSRFGLVGQGTIKPGLAVSYRQEIDAPFPFSDEIFNAADGHTGIASAAKQLRLRQHYFHYAQLGVSKQWRSFGKTTVFADRGFYKNFNVSAFLSINPDTNLAVAGETLTGAGVQRWRFAVEQGFDAAATLIYAQAHFYDPTIVGPACDFLTATVCCGDSSNTSNLPAGAWQGLVIGARMQFLNGRSSRTRWPNANTGDA